MLRNTLIALSLLLLTSTAVVAQNASCPQGGAWTEITAMAAKNGAKTFILEGDDLLRLLTKYDSVGLFDKVLLIESKNKKGVMHIGFKNDCAIPQSMLFWAYEDMIPTLKGVGIEFKWGEGV